MLRLLRLVSCQLMIDAFNLATGSQVCGLSRDRYRLHRAAQP